MPVFFVHDPARGIVTPLDRKFTLREISAPEATAPTGQVHRTTDGDAPEWPAPGPHRRTTVAPDALSEPSLLVQDIMSTPALCGRTEHTLQQAWATMSKYEIHHLAIVDEQMTLRGMLSSNRLLEFLLEQDGASPRETLLKTLLEQLCQGTVLSTGPQVAVGELAASMLAMGLDGVPVCRSGELVGMVTFSDIVRTSLGRSTLDVNA